MKMNAVVNSADELHKRRCRLNVFTFVLECYVSVSDELHRRQRIFTIVVAASNLKWMHPQARLPSLAKAKLAKT